MPGRQGLASDQVDDFDPVRLRAHRVLVDGFECTAALVDGVHRHRRDSMPTDSRNLPRGSIAKPRGTFSVGHLPIAVKVPLSGSIL